MIPKLSHYNLYVQCTAVGTVMIYVVCANVQS